MPSQAPDRPVIYVHARGRTLAGQDDVGVLESLGHAVCNRLGAGGSVPTRNGFDRPGKLLQEFSERYPDRAVVFLRAGLRPTAKQIAELVSIGASSQQPLALTLLSNACIPLNPFAGLAEPENLACDRPEELVSLLSPGYLHTIEDWPEHIVVLSPAAVEKMAKGGDSGGSLLQLLHAAGGRLAVPDHLYLYDPDLSLYRARKLQPWESFSPPPFGDLGASLQNWLDAGIDPAPRMPGEEGVTTLHVTHNWGGGIAHWIDSFIASGEGTHFQLRAEGPQSDRGCGQRLSLYLGTEMRCPIASWWLQPPIRSVEDSEPVYRAVLEQVCRRYGIGRIIVSSLIGHSLDVLRTGLPTLQVLHDHFPLWPLLSVHPEPFLREGSPVDIEVALASHPGKLEFQDKDAAAWRDIRAAYLQALADHQVNIAAPGQSVLDLQARLEPAFDTQGAQVIPHGTVVPEERESVAPRSRDDGRLRMVVLGRIQVGKGQKLLLKAVRELAEHVQVYLLGAGKSGEQFFGISGVDVIPQYEPDELPDLLRAIGPHFAALLSIVPETFSYTLSELHLLGIPAIATRVGSFTDRIKHGETGWMIDATPRALIEQVATLRERPAEIEKVRAELSGVKLQTLGDMRSAYDSAFPGRPAALPFVPVEPSAEQAQFAAAAYQLALALNKLESSQAQRAELQQELHDKTTRLGRELRFTTERLNREIDERTQWALDTQQQLAREHEVRLRVEGALDSTRRSLAELERQHQRLSGQYELVLGSTSWKVTKPLRASARVARNARAKQAWNPLRWPGLLSAFFGNVSRMGLAGALMEMQEIDEPDEEVVLPVPIETQAGETAAEGIDEIPVEAEAQESSAEQSADGKETLQIPGAFPLVDAPDVSIVLPVYNKWALTAVCLKSLAETPSRRSFELIVVDDASSDESQEQLSAIEGLVYIRNEENLGFVGSCNRGAGMARGEYLVMLNNDTEVQKGWLDALVDTLETEPGAGMVGSRLVYPNGQLQEAGGIIFNDGSGWNYGRDDDPEKPDYTFLREVDYCSGACIALKTELFEQLGGFDDYYAPAYYEDTDLAFRIREAGLKVLIQPAATVIHHEGATSGMDISTGMKRYQEINREKFVERWREALAEQPEPVVARSDPEGMRAASQHRVKGRVLFVGTVPPDASKLKKCRESGYGVCYLAADSDFSRAQVAELQNSGVEVIYGPWLVSPMAFFSEQGSRFDYVFVTGRGEAEEYRQLAELLEPSD